MKKNIIISVLSIMLGVVIILYAVHLYNNNKEDNRFIAIKSEAELKKVLQTRTTRSILKRILTLPISILQEKNSYNVGYYRNNGIGIGFNSFDGITTTAMGVKSESSKIATAPSNDFSKTNIQVENVDEADVVKTDGLYIYSISGSQVVISITDKEGTVENVSKINPNGVPQDMLIYKNKLVIISYNYPLYYSDNSTTIEVYDITNKKLPARVKELKLDKQYYTCRMIEDKVYVITSGYINVDKDEDEIIPLYSVDGVVSKMKTGNLKYIKNKKTNSISIIATLDLSNLDSGIDISGYLIPTANAYISENNMYIVSEAYASAKDVTVKECMSKLFSLKGIPGFLKYMNEDRYNRSDSGTYATIIKFKFKDNGLEYVASAKELGNTLNQFSMDEYKGNLRITLSNRTKESKLVVYSSEMKKIGEIQGIAPGEKIYATRFVKDRAYVVTYKTIDPLFVIDVANPKEPKILGELKIPGYSTYLHPYDENHIIGIGNDTQEIINRDEFGRVVSMNAYITGMKMAIFDVSDVKNPIEKFSQKIGDASSYSNVLQNHKAFLFSKEKELLAIPINNYNEKISINATTDMESNINLINNIRQKPTRNGYIVYKINLMEGFKQKGTISHDTTDADGHYWYNKNNTVRGIYIDNILYTISEKFIKSHTLETLEEKSSLKI